MPWPRVSPGGMVTLSLSFAVGMMATVTVNADDLPSFNLVCAAVVAHFKAKPDHADGDLITQDDFDAIDQALSDLGWKGSELAKLRERVEPSDSFLAKEAASREGRQFMRRVSRIPFGYDRLDHLSRLSDGRTIVRKLVKGPGGDQLIRYLATADGGREMGLMLSQAPSGEDFNRPTGRIYTEADLLSALKTAYDHDMAAGN